MSQAILLMPHFDDELFLCSSFLLNYKHKIDIYYSHEGDCINKESFDRNLEDLESVMSILNKYRESNGMDKVHVHWMNYGTSNRLGISEQGHKILCKEIEEKIENGEIDYFIIPSPSIHQSHQQCHSIGMSILREPYINNISKVLVGSYYVDDKIPNTLNSDTNIFIPVTEFKLSQIITLLKRYRKNNKVGAKLIGTIFSYYGYRCGEQYAQAFHLVYQKLTF